VSAASFILSAHVSDYLKDKKKTPGKKSLKKSALWDTSKFETGQWFSQTTYLQVEAINDSKITVNSSWGDKMYVSLDILAAMHSADHFKSEVPMTMSGLAELL
jgi:hypothetical protein